jgi:hypothetical protein
MPSRNRPSPPYPGRGGFAYNTGLAAPALKPAYEFSGPLPKKSP